MTVSGAGVAYSAAGFVLLWSGVKNANLKDTLTAFLRGQSPPQGAPQNLIVGVSKGDAPSGDSTGGNASIPATVGSPSARGTYSYTQLETLWVLAGGSSSLAPTMAAIALAESGGNTQAHNPSGASGLWQVEVPINDSFIPGGAAHVYNALDNARAAVAIEKAQGLSAWTTYTSGAYRQYLK